MKKLYFTLVLCSFTFAVNAQWGLSNVITFDPGDTFNHLITIDTVNYHHNIWQIGSPHKLNFPLPFTAPRAIVTDTLNPYPPNDTSAFILTMPYAVNASAMGGWPVAPAIGLEFYYKLRKDSGSKAFIEVSSDNGAHWYNLNDTLPYHLSLPSFDPSLSDTTTGTWENYGISMDLTYSSTHHSDTFLFRFVFISDSATPGQDGWIIDNIFLSYFSEGVQQVPNNNLVILYPNPSSGDIYLHTNIQERGSVNIYDMQGKEVYCLSKTPADGHLCLPLPTGTYMLRYTTSTGYAMKRLVIKR